MKKNNKTKLILISGGTASGKTTIANNIAKTLETRYKQKVNVVEIDNYYFEIAHWDGMTEHQINWDEPASINWEYFKSDIKKMMNLETVKKEKFDYGTNKYDSKKVITYKPANIIIIEGIFALYDEKLLNAASSKIFVDVDSDVRFIRRMNRDKTRHKNFKQKQFMKSWINFIKPMHEKWIQPQKSNATYVIQNNKELENPDFSIDDFLFII